MFLEEDNYASPDLLHVLGLAEAFRGTTTGCPECGIITLGNRAESKLLAGKENMVRVSRVVQ